MTLTLPKAVFFNFGNTLLIGEKPVDGIKEFLHHLKEDGVKIGIITQSHKNDVVKDLQYLGLKEEDLIIESFEDMGRFIKPFPQTLEIACHKASVSPADTWYVSNDKTDLLFAWFADCTAIKLPGEDKMEITSPQDVWSMYTTDAAKGIKNHMIRVLPDIWGDGKIDEKLAGKTATNVQSFRQLSLLYKRLKTKALEADEGKYR